MKDLPPIVGRIVSSLILDEQIADQPFATSVARGVGTGLNGDPVGDPMQPAPDRVAAADRSRLADQNQESCLEGIFGCSVVPDHGLAGTKHHRTVSFDQGRERGLITFVEKSLEELAIVQSRDRPLDEQAIDLTYRGTHGSTDHDPLLGTSDVHTTLRA